MTIPFHQEQLQFMSDLAAHRIEFLNPLFYFLNYFDTPYFFFILIPLLWIGVSYQWGLRIYFWSTLSTLINSAAKVWFGWPRPCTEMPGSGLLCFDSYGLPSGGAQTAMFLGILLIYYWKNRYALSLGLFYIALLSFSRLYLGVHFPIDILGGWIIGGALASMFIYSKEAIDRFFQGKRALGLCLSFIGAMTLGILDPKFAGFMAGIGLGTYLSLEYTLYTERGVLKALFTIALLLIFFYLGANPFSLALFLTLVASPLCKQITKYTKSF